MNNFIRERVVYYKERPAQILADVHEKTGSSNPWLGAAKRLFTDVAIAKPALVFVDSQERMEKLRGRGWKDTEILGIVGAHLILDLTLSFAVIGGIFLYLNIVNDMNPAINYPVAHTIGRSGYGLAAGIVREVFYAGMTLHRDSNNDS